MRDDREPLEEGSDRGSDRAPGPAVDDLAARITDLARDEPDRLAAEVARHVRPDDAAGMLRWRAGYLYYAGVRLEELDNDDEALELMSRPGRCLLLLHDKNLDALSPRLGPVEVLADQRVGHKDLMTRFVNRHFINLNNLGSALSRTCSFQDRLDP